MVTKITCIAMLDGLCPFIIPRFVIFCEKSVNLKANLDYKRLN